MPVKVANKSNEVIKPAKNVTMPIRPADKPAVEDVKLAEIPKPAAIKSTDDDKAIIEAVNNWAGAWSDKDVEKYLASYAQTFKPAKGESLIQSAVPECHAAKHALGESGTGEQRRNHENHGSRELGPFVAITADLRFLD